MNAVAVHSGAISAGSCGAGERHLQDLLTLLWLTICGSVENVLDSSVRRVRLEHRLVGASGTFGTPSVPHLGFKMRSAMGFGTARTGDDKKASR